MFRTFWPHLRALFVVGHLTAILLASLPAPEGGMNRALWKEPTARAEFEIWAKRLHVTVDELQDQLWKVASWWMDLRAVWMAPVRPYLGAVGAHQAWRMFAGANRFPTKLHFRIRDAGAPADAWRSVYERDNPELRWRAEIWEHERFRNGFDRFGWPHYRAFLEEACGWVSQRAFEDFPQAAEVRCSIWRERAPTPAQARSGEKREGYWWAEVTRSRPAEVRR